MCGIVGIFHYGNTKEIDADHLVGMRATLRHRGPDGNGLCVHPELRVGLASTRLAIRDLSSAGDQPFVDNASAVAVVFNGEIYNADELRSELEQTGVVFKSSSDTEVLLRLYCAHGEALLARLNGIFSFAVLDRRKRLLFIARDPLGVKPLYYFDYQGTFAFASEIKALLAYPGLPRCLNEEAVASYLTFACVPAPQTLFRHVCKLQHATLLRVNVNQAIQRQRYWSPISPELIKTLSHAPEEECVERVRTTLNKSVRAQLAGDVAATCSLSGGVDSSAVASLMSHFNGGQTVAFTIGFDEEWSQYNEYSYARSAARHVRAELIELCMSSEAAIDFLESSYAGIFDDPNADPVCCLAFTLAKEMHRRDFKVALSGEGADEIFIGYGRYLTELAEWRAFQAKAGAGPDAWFWGLGIAFRSEALSGILQPHFTRRYYDPARHLEPLWRAHREALECLDPADITRRLSFIELQIRLPEILLMRVDKASMANAIEYRVPFLDKDLVQLALAMPAEIKIKSGQPKSVLKRAVEGLIPPENEMRPKMGFALPVAEWLRDERTAPRLTQLITHSRMYRSGIVQPDAVQRLIDEHRSAAADHYFKLWTLMTLSQWYERWIA